MSNGTKIKYYLAIDIGASSGRHILGSVENGIIKSEEIFRFTNSLQEKNGSLCWNLEGIFNSVVLGLAECSKIGKFPETIGIDTWGVDFVLLDKENKILGDSVSYRDSRTDGMDVELEKLISAAELYKKTGCQKQIFNTVYQLLAIKQKTPDLLDNAEKFLMIPDYLNYRLTGIIKNEYTNASTTNMLNIMTNSWDIDLIKRIGIPEKLFKSPLSVPGEKVGTLQKSVVEKTKFQTTVILPATHDTGSAFLSVPAKNDSSVYISSGTWSLLGIETTHAITSEESMKANFTNEGGFNYRYRYLKNIMGLWIIQNCRKNLDEKYSFKELADQASKSKYGKQICIDINKSRFLAPKNMIHEIVDECYEKNNIELTELCDIMQCVFLSLAESYLQGIRQLSELSGKKITDVNIVGGGSKNEYLNQIIADVTKLPVTAGPAEGTALGNLLVQFIESGEFCSIQEARKSIGCSFELKSYAAR